MSDKFSISPTEVHRLEGQKLSLQPDFVAVEEPLEIKLLVGDSTAAQPISVTMRTPGNDESLALGFLFTEGIIKHSNDVQSIHVAEDPYGNALTVQLKSHVTVDLAKLERHFYTTSSCGVCGKASLEAVQQQCNIELPKTQWKVPSQVLYSLPDSLRNQQANFAQTGGIHGCALFDLDGNFILSAEDVGRHNALDKLIGVMAEQQQDFSEGVLLITSRASYEMVQKAAIMNVGVIAAISAPTSFAVEFAERAGVTLIGFMRDRSYVIYTHADRVRSD